MPTVPRYDGQQIASRGVPVPQQSTIATTAPNGLDALGKGIRQATEEINKQQQYADELRVEDEFNKLREKQLDLTLGQQNGYVNVKGKNALPGENGSLSDRYMQQYDSAANELAAGLANDRQKALFQRYAARAGLEFKSGLMRHENQEVDSWRKQTVDGVFAVEADNAAKNWNNPEAIDLSRGRIDINIGRLRDAEGVPAEEAQKIRLGALTKLHAGVIDNMVANKQFDAAKSYLEKYKDEIDAGTLLKASTEIKKEGDLQYAFTAAGSAVAPAAQALNTSDFGRLVNLVGGRESGNRERDANGNLITSSAGAQGKMQVMPGTNKDPGYGVTPARDDSDAERTRVGRDYLAALIKNYGGDLTKALAAYNAGPGRVDKAIKDAEKMAANEKADPNLKSKSWIELLPQETQDYVPAILSKYQAGLGSPKRETFEDVDARLRSDPKLINNPVAYKQAREFAKQQFDEHEQAFKKQQDELFGQAQRELIANGGNFAALPSTLRNQDPGKVDDLMKFATTIKKGAPTITDPELYQKLATKPELLKVMSDDMFFALRKDLSEEDFKHFSNERGKLKGQAVQQAGDLNSTAVNETLSARLRTLGIDPTPKDSDTKGNAQVGAIRQFVTRSVLDAQAASGKKMSDAEVVQHIDKLFATNTELKKGLIFDSGGIPLLAMKPSDVPSDAKDQIKAAFIAAGKAPTDYDIVQAYWIKKFGEKSAIKQAKPPAVATNTFNGQGK